MKNEQKMIKNIAQWSILYFVFYKHFSILSIYALLLLPHKSLCLLLKNRINWIEIFIQIEVVWNLTKKMGDCDG